MRRSHKPVHDCYDCPLNLGERCAVYEYPHDMWHGRHKCSGYKNEEMLKQWQADEAHRLEKLDAAHRREEMKERQTETVHEDGQLDPKHPKRSGFSEPARAKKKGSIAKPATDRRRR